MTFIEAVDVVVRVTRADTGEQRSFVIRRATLGFPGEEDDWSAETVTALRTIHDDDVYRIFDVFRTDD